MDKIGKTFALILIGAIAISSLSLSSVKPANSQVTTKPSIPEFNLKFVDASYDVPTTHTTDPYTGQDITHQGYHVSKTNLIMTVQNQPSVYQYNESFLYNIQVKGHYEENWTQLYLNDQISLADSSSAQTVLTMGTLGENGLTLTGSSTVVPYGGLEDFQIQAMIGGYFKTGFDHTEFSGQSSGWSNTQTVTIDASSNSPNPTAIGNLALILTISVIVAIIVLVIALLFYRGHRKNRN